MKPMLYFSLPTPACVACAICAIPHSLQVRVVSDTASQYRDSDRFGDIGAIVRGVVFRIRIERTVESPRVRAHPVHTVQLAGFVLRAGGGHELVGGWGGGPRRFQFTPL